MKKMLIAAMIASLASGPSLLAASNKGPKKGDLKKEFERVANPPPKKKADRPENNYNPPGPGPSKPKGPSPK